MEAKIMFTGTVDSGRLKISNRKQFDRDITAFEGVRVEGYIWRAKKRRSLKLNAYLWGVIYPCMVQGFKDIGHERVDTKVIHKFCKERWIDEPEEVVSPHTGEAIVLTKTTTTMTNTQMLDYQERIKQFAAEFLGIYIPDPMPLFQNKTA